MKKTTQVKKSKNLQELPSFSLGLTPSDEDKRDDIGDAKDNEKKNQKKKEHKKGDENIASRGRKKKPQIEAQELDETSSDDEHERNGKKVCRAVENVKQDMVKNDTGSSSGGGRKQKRKTGDAKDNEKKNKKKKEQKKGDESIA